MKAIRFEKGQAWTTRLAVATMGSALAVSLLSATPASAQTTLITTADGQVQGQLNDGTREFLGIPYAAPPVGANRFSPPQPPTPWVTPLTATTYPPACSQLPTLTNGNNRVENEDCLYLNVWTPQMTPVKPFPVMFWIHGGSNTSGSISDFVPFGSYQSNRLYDGHFLAQSQNVIVVTANYRLNIFGFMGLTDLAAEDPTYPYAGNQGLLDQRKAMQWVQTNIAAFGGDPKNVTIFGESAGSWDVCSHMVSPMSQGLFVRGISESGGCSVGVMTLAESQAAADTVATAVGCPAGPDRLACLRAVPTATLLDAGPLVALVAEGTNLALSVDGGFLPEHPRDTLNKGAIPKGTMPKRPYILGSNSDEGSLFTINVPTDLTEDAYQAELLTRFGTDAPAVAALYPSSAFETILHPTPDPKAALTRVVGDSSLTCSTFDVAARYAKGRQKAFVYNFNRKPPIIEAGALGVFHGLEIAYVFGSVPPPTLNDRDVRDAMQAYWGAFAKTGQPKVPHRLSWKNFNDKTYKILRFDSSVAYADGFRKAQCDFWSTMYDKGTF